VANWYFKKTYIAMASTRDFYLKGLMIWYIDTVPTVSLITQVRFFRMEFRWNPA